MLGFSTSRQKQHPTGGKPLECSCTDPDRAYQSRHLIPEEEIGKLGVVCSRGKREEQIIMVITANVVTIYP